MTKFVQETLRPLLGVDASGFGTIVVQAAGNFALSAATHGGKLTIVGDADGVITLPLIVDTDPTNDADIDQACNWGLTFRLFITVAATAMEINCTTDDQFIGALTIYAEGIAEAGEHTTTFFADGTDESIDMNGTTKGGLVGTYIELEATNSGWLCSKSRIIGSGTIITPFATA